jgi:uncharacterized membrane protein YphA (DoxX/SURF4 family)
VPLLTGGSSESKNFTSAYQRGNDIIIYLFPTHICADSLFDKIIHGQIKNRGQMKKNTIFLLTFIRVLTGWFFLYEGFIKLLDPSWTARYYLMGSRWIFAGLFHQMADSPAIMSVIDFANTWGLILIGMSLLTGLLVRWSSLAGFVLLMFYFVAYPPIPGYTFGALMEGSYLWINKTFLMALVLLVFGFLPNGKLFGLDRMIRRWRDEKAYAPVPKVKDEGFAVQRRELLRDLISLPFIGAFAYAFYRKRKWDSFEEKFLTGQQPDARTGATLLSFNTSQLDELQGQMHRGRIGDLELSRLIMGGNLIGGWAHARDLIYVSQLVKNYHTDERVMITLQLAEKCGVNSIITNPSLGRIMNKYWRETGGQMKFISDCGHRDGFISGIRQSEEAGAISMYCQGGIADQLYIDGRLDEIAEGLELIRSYGKQAGIGAHRIETIQGCVEQGIKPDYWVKTFHNLNYWSAAVDKEQLSTVDKGYKDNIYCFKPQETIDFMNKLDEPWIAFKVLAAGAIKPVEGFKAAFDAGADFICVGMYDFQIVEDCNIALETLANTNRIRTWKA